MMNHLENQMMYQVEPVAPADGDVAMDGVLALQVKQRLW